MKRKAVYLFLLMLTLSSVSACSKKTEETNSNITSATEADDEDKFSLGGISVDVNAPSKAEETTAAYEVDVLETEADGTYTALMSDGSTSTVLTIKDLPSVDKLSEENQIALDAIVSYWNTTPSLSATYLKQHINVLAFPDLSDSDCLRIVEKIQENSPHDKSETVAYKAEDDPMVSEEDDRVDTRTEEEIMESIEALSDEELNALIEEATGVIVIDDSNVTIDYEGAEELTKSLKGAQ